ncbi:MAG: ferredoxin [Spirochaetes bacterium GWF1_41_5]|nr:MAG: ferredoxin [Spirochaetes bacterium GWF1_41_5]HBE04259.1 ferredoxin [Spirochaetia bacterium]
MADKNKKIAENIPGRYYVDNTCIACGLCTADAQNNFFMLEDSSAAFVKKQPANAEEEKSCASVMDSCPVNAIGSNGV